jgi:glycosyltransferase involved in cell wall biosynthesis
MSNIEILSSRIVSVMEKNKIPFEVILVDDYSEDDTWRVIEKTTSERPNFVGIKNSKNLQSK